MCRPDRLGPPAKSSRSFLQNFAAAASVETPLRYSKFSQATGDKTWPSRVAMMIIYTPAFLASAALLGLGLEGAKLPTDMISIPAPSLAAVMCAIHFAKRCLEVLFVHKYSGRTDRQTPTFISVFYTFLSVLIAYSAGRDSHEHDAAAAVERLAIGTILFSIGIAGNFYHHYLLARLRILPSKDATSKYVAPRGGLFSYVAAPHYLFELIGWLGVAVAANHVNVYLVFAWMCSYLGGRSVAQNDFNRRKFDGEWPSDRKNLIPFVF